VILFPSLQAKMVGNLKKWREIEKKWRENAMLSVEPGLPDGLFSNQKYQLGKFWRAFEW
jgi:hypothetical protein